MLHAGNHIAADTLSHGLQWARVLQRKRESIHYWCRTIQLRRESGKPGLATNMRDEASCDPGQEMKHEGERSASERRAELSNLWGKWWSLEVHQTVKPSTWHELQHYLTCLLLLFLMNYCNAMVGARLSWIRPAPSEADTETGTDVWAGESTKLWWGAFYPHITVLWEIQRKTWGHIFTLHGNHSWKPRDERGDLVSIYIFYNSVCDISCPLLVMSRLSAKIKYLFVSC